MTTLATKTTHPYITMREGYAGGKPAIHGTRIKVSHIAVYFNVMGYSAARIVEMFPHLTLAQVYDALSYYHDHQDEIDAQIAEDRRFVEEMKKDHVSVLERKRGKDTDLRG